MYNSYNSVSVINILLFPIESISHLIAYQFYLSFTNTIAIALHNCSVYLYVNVDYFKNHCNTMFIDALQIK